MNVYTRQTDLPINILDKTVFLANRPAKQYAEWCTLEAFMEWRIRGAWIWSGYAGVYEDFISSYIEDFVENGM